MEILRWEKSLFRQHSSLVHSIIAPSAAPWPAIRSVHSAFPRSKAFLNAGNERCFSQRSKNAQQAAAPAPSSVENNQPSDSSTSTQSQPQRLDPYSNMFDDLMNQTTRPPRTRSTDRSSSSSPRTQAGNRSQSGSSPMDVEGAFASSVYRRDAPVGQSARPRGFDASRMVDPPSDYTSSKKPWTTIAGPPMPERSERPLMRLGPSFGRSVDIDPAKNMDVGKGFRRLDMLCSRNKIRNDFAKQRFHERPGLKRKRLKSERWRRRFKVAFKATIARVKELRSKGW